MVDRLVDPVYCLVFQALVETAKGFHSQGNFLAEEIQIRVAHIINRFDS